MKTPEQIKIINYLNHNRVSDLERKVLEMKWGLMDDIMMSDENITTELNIPLNKIKEINLWN